MDDAAAYVLPPSPPQAPLTGRNLEDFALCPRKYLLSFLVTRAESRERIGGPAALHRAVREAVLELYRRPRDERTHDVARAAFQAHWDGAACADSREEENLRRDGLLMIQRHVERPLDLGESPLVDLRLEGEIRGHTFVAVADLAGGDPPRVARLTTARHPPSSGELTTAVSWILLYLLGLAHFGDERLQAVMLDLRRGMQVPYSLAGAQRQQAEVALARRADSIRNERDFVPVPGQHCRWCRSRGDCPEWHRAR